MSIARRRLSRPKAEPAVRHRGRTINADKLKRALAERGLTSKRLAQLAKLSPATVSHGLNGHYVAPDTVKKIATVLARIPVLEGTREFLDEP